MDKYIKLKESNDLDWVDDLNLNSLDPNKRLSFIPPIGTRVRANVFDIGIGRRVNMEGEIISTENDVILLKLDSRKDQSGFGWKCWMAGFDADDLDSKCYYINMEKDEVYLIQTPINKLHESESELSVGHYLSPKEDLFMMDRPGKVRYATKGKIYKITKKRSNGNYVIVDNQSNEHSFSIDFINKNFEVLPNLNDTEKIFNDLFESEEDELTWAQEAINDNTFKFSDIKSFLNIGDHIEISGTVVTEGGEYNLILQNEPFILQEINGGRYIISWVNNKELRPINWYHITIGGGINGTSIELNPKEFPSDDDLYVTLGRKL